MKKTSSARLICISEAVDTKINTPAMTQLLHKLLRGTFFNFDLSFYTTEVQILSVSGLLDGFSINLWLVVDWIGGRRQDVSFNVILLVNCSLVG